MSSPLGATGTGKTATGRVARPSGCSGRPLVMQPNKTLAAQFANELAGRSLRDNADRVPQSPMIDYYQPVGARAPTPTPTSSRTVQIPSEGQAAALVPCSPIAGSIA